MSDIAKPMSDVTALMRSDPEYRHSWVANIAMAIYDTKRIDGESEIAWLNRGAEAFMDLLCR